jgi:thiol-disulfide isomerase/thioredoxin
MFFIAWSLSVSGQEAAISEEELTEFRVTLYTEKEHIPLLKLLTVEGMPYESGVLRDKYVLINFWATWCPFCRQENPSIQSLHRTYAADWFSILTISVGEEADTLTSFMRENGYDFPVVIDPENELKEIYAPRIPTTYILNPEGYIVARINGNKEWDSEQALKILRHLIPY